jgi:hypothetical protein
MHSTNDCCSAQTALSRRYCGWLQSLQSRRLQVTLRAAAMGRQQTAGIKIEQFASPCADCAATTGKICETGLLQDSDVERRGT